MLLIACSLIEGKPDSRDMIEGDARDSKAVFLRIVLHRPVGFDQACRSVGS